MNKAELIKNAKTELKKCYDFLKVHESALIDSHNLKYHDAFCFDYSSDFPLCANSEHERGENYLFYSFCNNDYEFFKDDLQTTFNIDFEKDINRIEHTSSFYLWNTVEKNCLDLLNTLLSEYFYNGSSVYLKSDLESIDFDSDFYTSSDIISDLKDITTGNFYKYIENETSHARTIYYNLKVFKDCQVESFKEFLQSFEDNLQRDIENENAKIAIEKSKVEKIAQLYNIPRDTMLELKKCISAYV